MVKATLVAISLAAIAVSCKDGVELDLLINPTHVDTAQVKNLLLLPEQICSDVTVTGQNGKTITGTRDCQPQFKLCTKTGDINCQLDNAELYGIHHHDLSPENTRQGVKIGDSVGVARSEKAFCQRDGDTNCVVTDDMIAVDAATIAGKTLKGQSLGGIAGTVELVYPSRNQVLSTDTVNGQPGLLAVCQKAGDSSCVATTALRAVAKSELVAANIRSGLRMGGVTGTFTGSYNACQNDNDTDCLATTALVAITKNTLAAAKIRKNVQIADAVGTLEERPGSCALGGATGCVTTASFPSADQSLLTAANLKTGVALRARSGTVTGQFPSAAHPLGGANPGVKDLESGNFAASLSSADAFEYWDSTGQRQQSRGDAALRAANLSQAVTIFGVTGAVKPEPDPCTTGLVTGCVTSSAHPSYQAAQLVPRNIKKGTTLGAVTGAFPSAAFPLAGAGSTADLQSATFNTQIAAGSTPFEYWDSTGARHTGAGTAELVAANLLQGATVFGVTGTMTAKQENCSDSNHLGCVTTSAHPAYSPAILSAGNIKKGVVIGQITGDYPSASFPLAGSAAGISDLSAASFNSQLRSPTNAPFEFWDDQGTRYQLSGSSHFSAVHIRQGESVFGVSGALAPRGTECGSANQDSCVAIAAFPSYKKTALTAAIIKKGQRVMGLTGQYPSAAHRLADDRAPSDLGNQTDLQGKLLSSTPFEFWDSAGNRHVSAGDDNFAATNIKEGVTILGLAGTMKPAPGPCSADGDSNCVATASHKSFDTRTLTASVIKKAESLGGIAGIYPSPAAPLAGAGATADLQGGAAFNGQVTSAGSVEYFDSQGRHYTKTIVELVPSDIKTGITLFGVAGSVPPSPSACTATTATGCLTSSEFPSYQAGQIAAGALKKGVQIGGVTGAYPSSAFPLANNTSMVDLDFSSFTARIKSSADFEFWDAKGTKYIESGSADIAAQNILKSKTIFNTAGAALPPTVVPVPRNKVRIGVRTGNQQGTVKVSCANTARSATTDNITYDDFNGDSSIPSHQPFGSDRACRSGTFVDQRLGGFSCSSSSRRCVFKDTISGLNWYGIKLDSSGGQVFVTLEDAYNYCSSISAYGGGWRLPTQKELFAAFAHGLRQASLANFKIYPFGSKLWTSTSSSMVNSNVKIFRPRDLRQYDAEDQYMRNLCVRGP